MLAALDATERPKGLRVPPGDRPKASRGGRAGQHSNPDRRRRNRFVRRWSMAVGTDALPLQFRHERAWPSDAGTALGHGRGRRRPAARRRSDLAPWFHELRRPGSGYPCCSRRGGLPQRQDAGRRRPHRGVHWPRGVRLASARCNGAAVPPAHVLAGRAIPPAARLHAGRRGEASCALCLAPARKARPRSS